MTRGLLLLLLLLLLSLSRADAKADCAGIVNVPLTRWTGDQALLLNGFCVDGYYFPRLLSNTFWRTSVPPTFFSSRFLFQNKGVIDATARERGLTLDGVDGYVALYTPSTLGFKLWIRPNAASAWIAVRQADSAARYHAQYHVEALWSGVEVSWELAQAWGIPAMSSARGRFLWDGQVCITEAAPLDVCVGDPVDLRAWFIKTAEYEQ